MYDQSPRNKIGTYLETGETDAFKLLTDPTKESSAEKLTFLL
jgi:hypothetical protein